MRTKKKLLNTQVWSILKYGSEVFSLTTALKKKLTAFEMRCYRRILKISWTNMITNEEVLRRVGETEEKLLKMIIKRKMTFFGHIARTSAGQELKTIIEGNDKKIGKGRRRTWWIDDVKQATGKKKIEESIKLAENRNNWKMLVRSNFGGN